MLAGLAVQAATSAGREVLDEETFNRRIAIERKRTERSNQPFLLMILADGRSLNSPMPGIDLEPIVSVLLPVIRETDIIGWYKTRSMIGVIYTGIVGDDRRAAQSMIQSKLIATLEVSLSQEQISHVNTWFHFFPDDWDDDGSGRPSNAALYPDLLISNNEKRSVLVIKRAMDIFGSLLMLCLCCPVFAIIAMAIKATSQGPIFFRQRRVGQYGRHFTFLKFRSMNVDNDHSAHKDFVTKFIASDEGKKGSGEKGAGIYKIASDPRVTRVGKFLRRTSLDELPQFLNVLKGEMSLVGPRPPIPYELALYETWHRRRLLEVKPGITGLWQVTGRSRVSFDEMVRLDLRYATSWSPSLDFTILMRTPRAVIKGEGAV
jgi:lipopolysaccharide/colanic/teichoic acid biosynthesis glycosyltransferase